jgi:hypothetical protein
MGILRIAIAVSLVAWMPLYAGQESANPPNASKNSVLKRVQTGDLCGYADENGKIIIPATYLYAGEFEDGCAKVWTTKGWGYINEKAQIVRPEFNPSASFRPEHREINQQAEAFIKITGDTSVRQSIKGPSVSMGNQSISGADMAYIAMHMTVKQIYPSDEKH